MLELMNRARANPNAEAARMGINLNDGLPAGTISNTPRQPLAFNPDLINAAQNHSKWMLSNNTFSHTGQGGSNPGDRMKAAGYVFNENWGWGENIAIQYGKSITLNQTITERLEDQLFKSPGHRVNILNGNFREAGVGVVSGTYKGQNAVDATQNFAFSGKNPILTGVAYKDLDGDRFYDPGEGIGGLNIQAKSSTGIITQTTTWNSGGYQMQLPGGTYQVTFSGSALQTPMTKSATVGSQNVKLDLVSSTPVASTRLETNANTGTQITAGMYGDDSGITALYNPEIAFLDTPAIAKTIEDRWALHLSDGLVQNALTPDDFSNMLHPDEILFGGWEKIAPHCPTNPGIGASQPTYTGPRIEEWNESTMGETLFSSMPNHSNF